MTIPKPYLLLILLFTGMIAGTLVLASLDENDWIAASASNHPPSVDVIRTGQNVRIRWYGGWTDSFISHVKVCADGMPCQEYVKPYPGAYIEYGMVPGNTTFDIFVYDQATQHYFNIKTVTV